jgi:MYXO-CTERM domain-containing protein
LTIDLGADVSLDGLAFWGYPVSGNSTSKFSLKFATEGEGTSGFGQSISYNPTFLPKMANQAVRQDFFFDQLVVARYVQMSMLDNFFGAPGAGGGDRVGFSEIQFAATPEPSTGLLALFGLGLVAGVSLRRRRAKASA